MTEKKTDAPAGEEWGDDEAPLLPAYKFEDGPFVGELLSVKDTPAEGLDGNVRLVPLFTAVTADGEKCVIWGTGMLSRVLPDLVGKGLVRIEDKGLEQQPGGTSLRIFDVRRKK